MAPPPAVRIDPTATTDFFVVPETAHVFTYKFWVRVGTQWHPIGPERTDDARSDHWIFMPLMPDGSTFAYWLGVWGHANTVWRARLTIAQRDPRDAAGGWVVRDTWTEDGTTDDQGNGGGVANTDIQRVELNS